MAEELMREEDRSFSSLVRRLIRSRHQQLHPPHPAEVPQESVAG